MSVEPSLPFQAILDRSLEYVRDTHGPDASNRLFFELYSSIFSHLDREFGSKAVDAYWRDIADGHLDDLESLMVHRGLDGMEEYWSTIGDLEGATFEMHKSDDEFELVVKHCPPTAWFTEAKVDCYPRYPEHCQALYGRVADRCGFDMAYTAPRADEGTCCRLRFTPRSEQ